MLGGIFLYRRLEAGATVGGPKQSIFTLDKKRQEEASPDSTASAASGQRSWVRFVACGIMQRCVLTQDTAAKRTQWTGGN
eukprot:symbB.v1.2.022584.t1/scaffold1981.1/size93869/7